MTIQAGERSGTTTSFVDRDGAQVNIDGNQGGSIHVSKEWGEAGREVNVTRPDGTGISGATTRGPAGSTRAEFETSAGGQGKSIHTDQGRTTVGRSESGDLYASRNGEVYKRGESGNWLNYQNGSWQQPDRGGSGASRSALNSLDYSNLNRQYSARQSGTRNYNQYRSQRSSISRSSFSGRCGGRRQ